MSNYNAQLKLTHCYKPMKLQLKKFLPPSPLICDVTHVIVSAYIPFAEQPKLTF